MMYRSRDTVGKFYVAMFDLNSALSDLHRQFNEISVLLMPHRPYVIMWSSPSKVPCVVASIDHARISDCERQEVPTSETRWTEWASIVTPRGKFILYWYYHGGTVTDRPGGIISSFASRDRLDSSAHFPQSQLNLFRTLQTNRRHPRHAYLCK